MYCGTGVRHRRRPTRCRLRVVTEEEAYRGYGYVGMLHCLAHGLGNGHGAVRAAEEQDLDEGATAVDFTAALPQIRQ